MARPPHAELTATRTFVFRWFATAPRRAQQETSFALTAPHGMPRAISSLARRDVRAILLYPRRRPDSQGHEVQRMTYDRTRGLWDTVGLHGNGDSYRGVAWEWRYRGAIP